MKREMNCFRALRLCKGLDLGAAGALLLACTGGSGLLAAGLTAAGASMLGGAWVSARYLICPNCEHHLFDWRRRPRRIPNHCPHCGVPLIPPKE